MKSSDTQIPYDAQCPHGTYYSDCQVCSGAKADFESWCYDTADQRCNCRFDQPELGCNWPDCARFHSKGN